MLKFRSFEIEDIKELYQNAIDDIVSNTSETDLLKYAEINKNAGPAFTGLLNDKPICAAGIHLRRGKSGHLWSVLSKSASNHKKTVFKSLKLMLGIVIKQNGLRKIITESRKGFPQSQRLIEHLGFIRQRHSFRDDYYFYRKVI